MKNFNLRIAVSKIVEENSGEMPYLLSIGGRAESIAEAFEQRLITAQEALAEWNKVIEDLDRIEERRKQSDLSRESFSALVFLEGRGVKDSEGIARETSTSGESRLAREQGVEEADSGGRPTAPQPGDGSDAQGAEGRR